MKNSLFISVTTILLLQCLTLNAATITVDGTNGAIDNSDGVCSISEAIINANNNNQTHTDCTAGTILDTINLTVDVTLTTVIDNDTSSNGKGRTGTPVITSGIILDGQGHTLQRDNTLTCNLNNVSDAGEFRILRTSVTAGLILQNITLAHGCADSNFTLGRSGGGIYSAGDLIIKKTTFDQNKSKVFGGALYHQSGAINEISNSTFSENSADSSGGAIYKNDGNIEIIQNSTFSRNTTLLDFGGAIYNFNRNIRIIYNCTFSENSSRVFGNAIFNNENFGSRGTITTIRNSLFHNHTDSDCSNLNGVTLLGNNISTRPRGQCNSSSILLTASSVGPLADNGGPTLTHALLQGSEALNGGGIAATAIDQRDFAADGVRDIGAYEAQIPVVTAPTDIMLEATGALSSPTLGVATVVDVDEIGLSAIPNPSSFALGTHTVTWTATDSQGFVDSDTQQVTIVDTTAPVITPPVNIVMEATGLTTSVTLGVATASDLVDGVIIPTANMSSPFGVGTHTITWSATDIAGNTGTAIQTVTITDTTAPIVTAPADIVIESTGTTTPVTLGTATAVDIVDGNVTPVSANISSPFAVDVHSVIWSATDNAGNTGTDTQLVNVQAVISGNVSGLNGSVTLQNNGGDDLALTTDGNFRFTTALDNLSPYAITVLNQPTSQFCIVNNANGQVNGNNISNILIDCTDLTLSLNTASLDFGGIFIGTNKTQTIILNNTSTGALTINQITNPSAPFSIISSTCSPLPFTINPGDTCQLVVSFEPTYIGGFTSDINIFSNAVSSPNQIILSGVAAAQIIPTLNLYGLILLIFSVLFLSLKMNLLHYPKS